MAVATKAPSSLAEALAKFQQEHHAAGKDGKANYGFYTTLAGGLNAVQPATHLGLCHKQREQPIPFWRLANALEEFHGGGC